MADFDFDNMINKLKTNAVKVTKEAGKITKDAINTVENKTQEAKLLYSVQSFEKRLDRQFAAIGSSVYNSFKNGEEQEDFSELFGRIDALKDEIEELKQRIASKKNTVICKECNAYIDTEDAFCPKCGAKVKENE